MFSLVVGSLHVIVHKVFSIWRILHNDLAVNNIFIKSAPLPDDVRLADAKVVNYILQYITRSSLITDLWRLAVRIFWIFLFVTRAV